MIIVYSTFPSRKKAKEIGEALVKKKLAGCVNIFAVDSIYSWQDKTEEGNEFVAVIKSKKENFKKIEKFILQNHGDSAPCVLEIPVARVSVKYLRWLKGK